MIISHKKRYQITAICCVGLSLLFLACSNKNEAPKDYRFEILDSQQTGIDFRNDLKNTPERNILNYIYYYNGGGVAAGDFNTDGLVDLYFTANEGPNALYLNQGDFKFKEVAAEAGVLDADGWSTGVTTVDINQDGLLDIYVCKVSPLDELNTGNKLFINQGLNEKGDPVFKEDAATYGLDFKGYSTQASFFDYDKDGDLDIFLLNHTVNPNSNYGRGAKRLQIDSLSGDRLYENQDGYYTNVSEAAGILQSPIGYGLGLGTADINNDGYPEIYVGNDFFENDYLYLNNTDGTFTELISSENNPMGHTSHYSMGNDLADLNNDGLPEILSVDMLPEDLSTYKSSGVEFGYSTYKNYLLNGYSPQYMQNNLHFNQGNMRLSETAFLSGVAATEWSWAPLIADLDNDGFKDIFVSNGIAGATNDMDFINFIADEKIQRQLAQGMTQEEMSFINNIPEKRTVNYLFKNKNGQQFIDMSEDWVAPEATFSNGSINADLDNDGDLDLVTNNVNGQVSVYRNLTSQKDSTKYVQLQLKGMPGNLRAIGAKVSVYTPTGAQHQEVYATRGYLSAVDTRLHFGLGKSPVIDTIIVRWADGAISTSYQPKSDQVIVIDKNETAQTIPTNTAASVIYLKPKELEVFAHKENASLEFNMDPLIAYASTNEGPDLAIADVNNDGLEDVLFCGAKGQASVLMLQLADGRFTADATSNFAMDGLSEDTGAKFADLNGDGYKDLIVVSGGNEFTKGSAIKPRLYWNKAGQFTKDDQAFNGLAINASGVATVDFDGDGDLDISISADGLAKQFGSNATQYLLRNEGNGKFADVTAEVAPQWLDLGKVKEIIWQDVNADGWQDALVVGHWMPLQLYINDKGRLIKQEIKAFEENSGLWESAVIADFDADGDMDIVAGNWGLNSRLTATIDDPLRLYRGDFNGNGSKETLITYNYKGQETLLPSKDELAKQIPQINKDFLSYESYANATTAELFIESQWSAAQTKVVTQLATTYFENLGDGNFNTSSLPFSAQISTVNDIFVTDFNTDGFPDVFLVGNRYEVSTQLGRLDALKGAILLFDPETGFNAYNDPNLNIDGSCRAIQQITINNQPHVIVSRNNDTAVVLEILNDVIQTPNE